MSGALTRGKPGTAGSPPLSGATDRSGLKSYPHYARPSHSRSSSLTHRALYHTALFILVTPHVWPGLVAPASCDPQNPHPPRPNSTLLLNQHESPSHCTPWPPGQALHTNTAPLPPSAGVCHSTVPSSAVGQVPWGSQVRTLSSVSRSPPALPGPCRPRWRTHKLTWPHTYPRVESRPPSTPP